MEKLWIFMMSMPRTAKPLSTSREGILSDTPVGEIGGRVVLSMALSV